MAAFHEHQNMRSLRLSPAIAHKLHSPTCSAERRMHKPSLLLALKKADFFKTNRRYFFKQISNIMTRFYTQSKGTFTATE
jgi:hypothetical protein